jgi:hypothetical protein
VWIEKYIIIVVQNLKAVFLSGTALGVPFNNGEILTQTRDKAKTQFA